MFYDIGIFMGYLYGSTLPTANSSPLKTGFPIEGKIVATHHLFFFGELLLSVGVIPFICTSNTYCWNQKLPGSFLHLGFRTKLRLIDVSQDKNGCGGCTKKAMNSDEPGYLDENL